MESGIKLGIDMSHSHSYKLWIVIAIKIALGNWKWSSVHIEKHRKHCNFNELVPFELRSMRLMAMRCPAIASTDQGCDSLPHPTASGWICDGLMPPTRCCGSLDREIVQCRLSAATEAIARCQLSNLRLLVMENNVIVLAFVIHRQRAWINAVWLINAFSDLNLL
jgi:hypothetical protein